MVVVVVCDALRKVPGHLLLSIHEPPWVALHMHRVQLPGGAPRGAMSLRALLSVAILLGMLVASCSGTSCKESGVSVLVKTWCY